MWHWRLKWCGTKCLIHCTSNSNFKRAQLVVFHYMPSLSVSHYNRKQAVVLTSPSGCLTMLRLLGMYSLNLQLFTFLPVFHSVAGDGRVSWAGWRKPVDNHCSAAGFLCHRPSRGCWDTYTRERVNIQTCGKLSCTLPIFIPLCFFLPCTLIDADDEAVPWSFTATQV